MSRHAEEDVPVILEMADSKLSSFSKMKPTSAWTLSDSSMSCGVVGTGRSDAAQSWAPL